MPTNFKKLLILLKAVLSITKIQKWLKAIGLLSLIALPLPCFSGTSRLRSKDLDNHMTPKFNSLDFQCIKPK